MYLRTRPSYRREGLELALQPLNCRSHLRRLAALSTQLALQPLHVRLARRKRWSTLLVRSSCRNEILSRLRHLRGQQTVGALQRRLALLEAEGWQANIGYTGEPGIVEYQVARPRVATAMAIAARTEAADPSFWPPDLTPEARAQLIAPWPSRQTFRMVEWVRLVAREV